jgi:hypothetical protein
MQGPSLDVYRCPFHAEPYVGEAIVVKPDVEAFFSRHHWPKQLSDGPLHRLNPGRHHLFNTREGQMHIRKLQPRCKVLLLDDVATSPQLGVYK